MKKGFSAIEIVIVLAIMIVILSITIYSYSTMKTRKQVEVAVDAINFRLEEAKTNALSGKNGANFGIYFATSSYTYFSGSSYDSSNTSNVITTLSDVQISKSLTGGASSIIFTRITGTPQVTGTVTVTSTSNASTTAVITIGTLGDINVVK